MINSMARGFVSALAKVTIRQEPSNSCIPGNRGGKCERVADAQPLKFAASVKIQSILTSAFCICGITVNPGFSKRRFFGKSSPNYSDN